MIVPFEKFGLKYIRATQGYLHLASGSLIQSGVLLMAAQIHSLAIMHVDISGSTPLYESLGDVTARRLVANCLATLTDITINHQGTVVKSIGDELLCIFHSALAAVNAGAAMHEALEQTNDEQIKLGVRIGINYGETMMEEGDVFGDAVNLSSRVASMTKVNQILCTGQVIASLGGHCPFETRFLERQGSTEIYEVIWKQLDDVYDMTIVSIGPMPVQMEQGRRLSLELEGRKVELGGQRTSVTLGRGQNNDLITSESLASRTHARIEYRHGKFLLQDQSTNGTFVRSDDGHEVALHREELPLQGSGLIGLGRIPKPNNPNVLRFHSSD